MTGWAVLAAYGFLACFGTRISNQITYKGDQK